MWCISDIELIDQYGCPTLSPSAADLHPLLASSKLIPEQTFIRYHSVNRFNGHRQCFDSESRLITKGSIITLNLDPDVSESELRSELSNGIGINRHLGYGLVVINPIWAQQPKPKQPIFLTPTLLKPKLKKIVHTQATPLTQWVTSQLNHSTTRRTAQREAIILAEEIVQGYHHARKYNNVPDAYQIGPSRSQWRRINDLLRSELSQQWASKTFEGEHRIAKATNDPQGWGAQWIQEECSTTFADYCNIHMSGRSEASLLKAIEILTRANPAESEGLKRITLSLRDEKKQ
ncbi:hypothetical protein QW180_30935 [Vibrio sinaloensis]|nr:hypothetical protein [Vibrio sinaloensis]